MHLNNFMGCHGDICFHDGITTLQLVPPLSEGGGESGQAKAQPYHAILQHGLEVPLDPVVGQTCGERERSDNDLINHND